MTLIHTLTILICLAAGFGYINQRWLRLPVTIGVMATRSSSSSGSSLVGTVLSALLIGVAAHWLFGAVGLSLPFLYCLLFGAFISPTDPIAVLGILRKAGLPEDIEVQVVGESLFNDGVVVFSILVQGLTLGPLVASWRR